MRRFAAALLLVATATLAQPAVPLDLRHDEVRLDGALSALADPDGTLGLDEVRRRAGAFRPVGPVLSREQMLPAAVWLRLRVEAPPDRVTAWGLETPAERIDVYWTDSDGEPQHRVAGIDVPKAERSFARGYPALVPFVLDRGEARTLWVRVAHDPDGSESTSELRPLRLKTAEAALRDGRSLALWNGLFLGYLLALALYNLALFAGFGDRSFLYYVAYVAGIGLYFATTYRVLFDAFWPDDAPWTPGVQTVAVHVAAASYALFVRHFLGPARIGRGLDRLLRIGAAGALAGLVVIPLFGWRAGGMWTSVWVLALAVVSIAAMARAWQRGYGPGGVILASFVVLAASTAGYLGPQFGLPRIEWAMEMVQVGVALEALLLALALTSRARALRTARAAALDEKARAEADRARAVEANRALQDALRLKSNLLGFAAHDLRSPLTTVLGYAEMLEAGEVDPVEAAGHVQRASTRLLRLIDDLLVTAALEGREVPVRAEPVDLGPLVGELVAPFGPLAAAKGQRLEVHAAPGAWARADPERVAEVVDNLVSNALKYTPRGGTVEVEVRGSRSEAWVSVADSGPGLTAEDRERLFRPFTTLSARPTGGEASTGLGLSIVRRIVELHGGRVEVDSEPGQGARFTAVFEAARPAPPAVEAVEARDAVAVRE